MTRVAVIADTHLRRGLERLPERCLELLRGADRILHAGDISTRETLEALRTLGPPVDAVCGNVDEPALRELLPERAVVEVDGVPIGLVHDAGARTGREERLASWFPGCGAVVYGHTHLPQVELVGGVWILNPGSPTQRRRAPQRTALVLNVEANRLEPVLVGLP